MSNVHTLGDLNRNAGGGGNGGPDYGRMGQQTNAMGMGPQDEESKQAVALYGGLMGQGGGQSAGVHPLKENYFDMWKTTFCPSFSPISFTFMIWVVNTLVYIATLFMTIPSGKELNYFVFLGPDPRTLENWGALDPYKLQHSFQVWRLIMPLFLSVGFSQYMICSGALMIIGFMVENPKMSPSRMAILYCSGGILGNLFSACVEDQVSVGCLPAIMALISAMLGSVIVNWKALAGAGMMRICLIFMMVMICVIVLLLSVGDNAAPQFKSISMAGEGGGFMAGLGLGMMLMPHALQRDSPYVKMIRKIGFIYTLLFAGILFPVFFFAANPGKTIWAN